MNAMKKLSLAVLLASLGLVCTQSFAATNVLLGETVTETALVQDGANSIDKTFSYTFGAGVTAANFIFDFADTGSTATSFSVSPVSFANLVGGTAYDAIGEVYGTNYTFSFTGSPSLSSLNVRVQATYAQPFDSSREYSLTVAAVPEPETYAMLLAGLGMMAGVARRRSISA